MNAIGIIARPRNEHRRAQPLISLDERSANENFNTPTYPETRLFLGEYTGVKAARERALRCLRPSGCTENSFQPRRFSCRLFPFSIPLLLVFSLPLLRDIRVASERGAEREYNESYYGDLTRRLSPIVTL